MKKRSVINAVNAYQDCRSTMYDCLRAIIDTSPNVRIKSKNKKISLTFKDHCTSTVLREREKINIYQNISSKYLIYCE